MASRIVQFDLNSLVKLLVHYTDGEIPLDSEPSAMHLSQILPRWVVVVLRSKDWTGTPLDKAGYGGTEPFHIRYEAKRLLQWQGKDDPYGQWSDPDAIEAPRRQ